MNALRKLSGSGSSSRSSGSAAPTQYVVTVSRAGGSFGLGLSDDNVVTTVAEKSSAAEASIQPNDRVVTVDGQPVGSRKLVSLLAENRNTEITLGIERGSSSVARKSSGSGATPRGLGLFSSRSKSNTQTDDVHRTGSFADMGERILTLRLARESDGDAMGLEVDQTNKVTAVMADTVAHKAGLQVGDVVTKARRRAKGGPQNATCPPPLYTQRLARPCRPPMPRAAGWQGPAGRVPHRHAGRELRSARPHADNPPRRANRRGDLAHAASALGGDMNMR